MGPIPRIAPAWHVIKRHPVVSAVLAIMAAVASYDTFSGQFEQLTDRQLPSLHKLFGQSVVVGGHLLPWWGWIIMLLVTLNVALIWQRRPAAPTDSTAREVKVGPVQAAIPTPSARPMTDPKPVATYPGQGLMTDPRPTPPAPFALPGVVTGAPPAQVGVR